MKKIYYLYTILLGAIMVGCNPMEDIHEDAKADEVGVIEEVSITLTDDDYDELDLSYGSFNSEDEAKELLPDYLGELYPYLSDGSSITVGYMLYVGTAEGVSDLTSSDIYQLTNADYASAGSDAFGFYPNVDAASMIPDVLEAQIASPTEGQIILAKYDQYTEVPEVGLADLVSYNFAGSMEGWSVEEEFGSDAVWTSETGYVQGNSYFGGQVANTEWLVSPSIDLTDAADLKFQITQELDYAGDASLLKILVSTDYTDDILTATWDEITLANPATGDMAASEDYDFSAYDGQTINIAFKYESTDSDAARWRIESVAIKVLGATGATDSKGEYFIYTEGAWEAIEGVYYLSSGDFDSMGEGSGQPGQYDNFGSSIPPNNYLPTFMSLKFPYGQEEEEMLVIYDYYSSSSGAQRRGNLFTVIDGVWTGAESTIETTLQFGLEDGIWVPDNTIRYTLVPSDYTLIVESLSATYPAATGSMDNYGNFERRPGNAAEWTDEMIAEAMDYVLNELDPSAEEGQKYLVTFDVYNGSSGVESLLVIKTDGVWQLPSE
ncbi:choice-of-anchor J domain-containing protein [Aestuariibaculum sp. YM273]|uniref:choice-of-anchor J domain-containing protein n=1 Tax=Aestuariibaculum sp. YM273 TaxID=3070659 RepID=UPI0027DE488C|nr:choice-of-anchor J domain-containing protein [Aestuariibaculum sp. YM273]WMI66465.1 choice-of-anchor J domain-containing protein [Aestuariibaculum sp. YM273]